MNESPPSPPRRLLILANPIAGGGRSRVLVPRLCAALRARGVEAHAHFTTSAGDARARAATAGGEDWDGLVAVGGDGTVNEILNGMPDVTRPLGVLPVGTANVLAIELGLPWSPEAAAEVLAAGRMRPLAVGTAAAADALAARRFLLFCGAGLDGAIVHRLAAVRTGTLGKRKWAGPILHAIRHWPRFALRAELDGGEVLDGLGSVLVTRVRNYGGVMRLTPDVDPSDGLLHVLGFRMHTRRAFAWQCLRGLTLGLRAGRDLLVRTTTGLRVTGSAPLQVDGDAGGTAPVDVGLLPARARVFAPNMAGTTSRTASGARAPD